MLQITRHMLRAKMLCPGFGDTQQQNTSSETCAHLLQVPYDLREDDTPDDWECHDNKWDTNHASCSVPQELTDKEIDEILALQVMPWGWARIWPQP